MRTLFRYILGITAMLLVFALMVVIVTGLTVAVSLENVVVWIRERLTKNTDIEQQ